MTFCLMQPFVYRQASTGLEFLPGVSGGDRRCADSLVAGHATLQIGGYRFMEVVRWVEIYAVHFTDEFGAADLHADARVVSLFLTNG